MQNFQLGEVIAERRLKSLDESGVEHDVVVYIGKPAPDPKPGGDWYCPLQILGTSDDSVRAAYGADAVQALLLGLQMIAAQLHYYEAVEKQKLTWLGQHDLGFLRASDSA